MMQSKQELVRRAIPGMLKALGRVMLIKVCNEGWV